MLAPQEAMSSQISNAGLAARYLTLIGTVMLIHDHIVTFSHERRFIWTAPRSMAKYAFLINRYIVPVGLFLALVEMCGFSGVRLSNVGCRSLMSVLAVLSTSSIAVANLLVLQRVIVLWDGNKIATWTMNTTFAVICAVTFATCIISLVNVMDGIVWSNAGHMCVLTKSSWSIILMWGASMVFELLVLVAVCWNAFDRPRDAQVPIRRALHRDGITFFAAVLLLRLINVVLAATLEPSEKLLAVFFVWALVTLTLNRLIIRLQRAELSSISGSSTSPFSAPPTRGENGRASPFAPRVVLPRSPSPSLPIDMENWALDMKARVGPDGSGDGWEGIRLEHPYRGVEIGHETVVNVR